MKVPENYRLTSGHHVMSSDKSHGNNGCFILPLSNNSTAYCICSDGEGWEHLSVHIVDKRIKAQRTPTWAEMCKIKDLFWNENETVIQYHPPKSEYINNHKHTLHLWRPVGIEIPMPPKIMVGI